jgi:hypothetical protein
VATWVDALGGGRDPASARQRAWRAMLGRWGISVASLASGIVTLVVFRRGIPHVGLIAGYAVVLWALFVVLDLGRARFLARGRTRVVMVGEYTIQTLYHGLLLFVLPGYFESTTFDGVTAPFFLLLVAAAVLTSVDPWYRALVQPRPWLGRALFVLALFASLNVALVLLGVRPAGAAVSSAGLAGLALLPVGGGGPGGWPRAAAWSGTTTALALLVVWLGLPAIPPAPLGLVRPTIARAVANLEPLDPVARVSVAELAVWGGLVAYTPVTAPPRLAQPIVHRWRHEGREVTRVALPTPVRGGRQAGFRTFSRKTDFPPDPRGRWMVDVVTASGQLIGRLRFVVES